jgi:DinB superfamily
MTRAEIEVKLHTGRAWLVETFSAMNPDDLARGATQSEHDKSLTWTPLDHLAHLAGIEHAFNGMIRRHLAGEANPVGVITNPDGTRRPMEEIMATVHKMNEEWVSRHRGKSLQEMLAVGEKARAETLGLLGDLSDYQLQEKLPGAPWADGTIGGVIGVNADHERMHYQWLTEGLETRRVS